MHAEEDAWRHACDCGMMHGDTEPTPMNLRTLIFGPKPFLERTEVRITIASFMILFLELALIRWLAAYILHLAYFSNLVLLGSFFGIGLGFLLSGKKHVFRWFPLFLLACVVVVVWRLDVSFLSPQALYFQELSPLRNSQPLWMVAPFLFAFVAAVFVGPAQVLGTLFRETAPLNAYTWDLVGSIAGSAAFAALSALGVGPIAWFAVVAAAYVALRGKDISADVTRNTGTFIVMFALLIALTANTLWSPYYKLVVVPVGDEPGRTGYAIYANETGHQTMERPENKEWVYQTPYEFFSHPQYKNALIIGAGSGSDVAIALQRGVSDIDAVDIDPTIVALGKALHPSRPYQDPRVHATIADGRTFLERTDKKYDLIVFALTDSLALASSYSNTRLESYLFTQESFERAKERLAPGGLLVLYNYYRQQWLVDKLSGMLRSVFGQEPYVVVPSTDNAELAAIMVGPKLADLKPDEPASAPVTKGYAPATDSWPFIYLTKPGFPGTYASIIGIIAALCVGAILLFRRDAIRARAFPWHFFLLGAGFMLVETKNVINFQLLFGSTWLVNALVVIAILGLVLAAVLLTRRGFRFRRDALYACLVGALILNLLVPLSALAALPAVLKYAVAAVLTLSPVFFANLIFSASFKAAKRPDECFAANLLGSMVGGFSEYSAMAIGYHWLIAVALAFYVASWLTPKES